MRVIHRDGGSSPEYWEQILDSMPDVIIGTNSVGDIIFCKGHGVRHIGISERAIVGRNIAEILKTECSPQIVREPHGKRGRYIEIDSSVEAAARIVLYLADHITMSAGQGIWVFQNHTNRLIVEKYLDAYHDSLEKELIREIEEKSQTMEKLTHALVSALENANQYNDDETRSHIYRVGEYSGLLAEAAGGDLKFVKKIRLYAPLHDIGKVGIPDGILKKEDLFSREEYLLMRNHVRIGASMLDHSEIDDVAKNIVRYHHEKWDGSGYLEGLSGTDIPLEARIVAVADSYDGMRSVRNYRLASSHERAVNSIREMSGSSFDPDIVELFLRVAYRFERISGNSENDGEPGQ